MDGECVADVSLSLTTTETSATISYTSNSNIATIRFNYSGILITGFEQSIYGSTSAGGGTTVSASVGSLCQNCMGCNGFPAGSGTLITFYFEPLSSPGQLTIDEISIKTDPYMQ